MFRNKSILAFIVFILILNTYAQQRITKKHDVIGKKKLNLLPTNFKLSYESEVLITKDDFIFISGNGIPDHLVGRFPNKSNPHTILPQKYKFKINYNGKMNKKSEPLRLDPTKKDRESHGRPFGVSINSVLFDPGTAEFWMGDKELGWNYCALGAAIPLGLDDNHAHVQPNGSYHYHGLPTGLLNNLDFNNNNHSPLVGWSADGFPIYALIGFKNNTKELIEHKSSFKLRSGFRPNPPDGPGGRYDGTFVQDYEYIKGLGTLDECNGYYSVTPEFPNGIYAYFLTEEWPVIPRNFRGKAINLRDKRNPK